MGNVIFSAHLKVRLQISASMCVFKHLPLSRGFPDSRLSLQPPATPVALTVSTYVKESVKKGYGHPGMKGMNHVLKCPGREGNMAHPLRMRCHRRLSCLCYCWAGPGRQQPLHSMSRSLSTGTCFCSEQLGQQLLSHISSPYPGTTPQTPLPFFHSLFSFYLAALFPALKIGPPGAEAELCKWKQQIELPMSRSKQ